LALSNSLIEFFGNAINNSTSIIISPIAHIETEPKFRSETIGYLAAIFGLCLKLCDIKVMLQTIVSKKSSNFQDLINTIVKRVARLLDSKKLLKIPNITKISKHIYAMVKLQKESLADLLSDHSNTKNIEYRLSILALTQAYILL
jgi:hypothetical protein